MYQDPNSIVNVQVSTILAPYPATLQQTGAIVSFGGTNILPNSRTFLTQFTDLKPLLNPAASGKVTSATFATGVITYNIDGELPTYATTGTTLKLSLTGIVPNAYNGVFDATVVTPTSFTVPAVTDPGAMTTPGTWQLNAVSQLNAQVATFFRQGTAVGIWLLELGYQPIFDTEVAALADWLTTSPGSFYGYLLPDYWGTPANLAPDGPVIELFQQYVNPEAMTYFWVTLSGLNAVGLIDKTNKSVIQMMEAPGVQAARAAAAPGTFAEFSLAGMFYWAMRFRATAVTRVSPMCFKYIYGVTPYPVPNNGPTLSSFKTNCINYIQTGAQGGISYTNVYQGVTADGFDYFNWWWTIDWVQINVNLNIANAVINGSNNPTSPLYYNQVGVSQLQGVLARTMLTGNQYGMVNGPVIQSQLGPADLSDAISAGAYAAVCNVNAVPFATYTALNPADYGTGEYDGLSTLFIPARGFVHILVTVVATNIVTL
jgi:hypothetical protein